MSNDTNKPICSFCGIEEDEEVIILKSSTKDIYICENCLKTGYEYLKDNHNDNKNNDVDENLLTPEEIRKFLDQYVIGQDKAKKILSTAVYNHMKILNHYDNAQDEDVEIEKSNVIMLGPSGSGKTHIVKSLARLFKVPYAIVDATSLTESGYVGADVETILQKLLLNANGDVKRAERGIIFIDEIDKKANKGLESMNITRDVSGEGVQQALLKILEGTIVDVPVSGKRVHPEAPMIQIDTSKILFIVGGAFPGIEKIIKKRLNYKDTASMGLKLKHSEEEVVSSSVEYNNVIDKVTTEDLKKYGLIPEILGRLPVICTLKELTEDELCDILVKPKNALVKQYSEIFKYDNIELKFDNSALRAIAQKAIKNKTGARGLRAIMESLLLESMYSLPGKAKSDNATVTITKETVEDDKDPDISFYSQREKIIAEAF